MFDIVILLVLAVSVLVGFFRGFVKEALSIITWIAAIWLSLRFYKQAGEFFADYVGNELFRNVAGFAAVFLITLFTLSMLTYLIGKISNSTGIKGTDKVLGFIFGIIRGALLVVALMLIGLTFNLDSRQVWHDSKLIPVFMPIVDAVNNVLPEGIRVDGVGGHVSPQSIPEEVIEQSADK